MGQDHMGIAALLPPWPTEKYPPTRLSPVFRQSLREALNSKRHVASEENVIALMVRVRVALSVV
jgi:hypothetical protein